SADTDVAVIDNSCVYVQRGGSRVYEVQTLDQFGPLISVDVSAVIPEIGQPGVVAIGVQRQPDTRIHLVRSDGTVAILVYDSAENVQCWIEGSTDGFVEDVVIKPDLVEDRVYYSVRRVIGEDTIRCLEKWALESECQGEAL